MPYITEERQAELFNQLMRLERVAEAAEVLSTAMVASEASGGNYDLVDEPWQHLTAAIQNWRREKERFVPVATVRIDT